MNISDLVVILILALCVLIGWKRGLMLSVVSSLSIVIAIVLAIVLNPIVAKGLNATGLPETFSNGIYEKLEEISEEKFENAASVEGGKLVEEMQLPSFIEDYLEKNVDGLHSSGAFGTVARSISDSAAALLIRIISMIIVFVLVIILMIVLKIVIKGVRQLPVIKQFDKAGGLIFGFVQGLLILCVLALLLCLFSSTKGFEPVVLRVEHSLIAKFFYENNFLGMLIARFF